MKEDILKIINHYGLNHQLKYFQSEVFELNEAILEKEKVGAYPGIEEIKHIAEEIADIKVMLRQFQEYYNIPIEEIEDVMKYKVRRQLERIKNEK